MRIGIDARMMGANNTRGIGRYIQELYTAMVQARPDLKFVVFSKSCNHALTKYQNVETVIADINWYGWKEQIQFLKIINNVKVDLMHFPHWNVPIFYDGPFVLTIHDLLLKHNKYSAKASTRFFVTRWLKRIGYKLVLDNAVKKAGAICVPTDFTAEDVQYFFPEQKNKLIVTGEGIPDLSKGIESAPDFSYLLYVGSAYPHKRLDLLMEAWSELAKIYPDKHLVVAGEVDVFMERVKKQARSLELERVHFLGSVADAELGNLYQKAELLVFPSEFEGFGLPPFESLSMGTPVVTADARPIVDILLDQGVVYFKSGDKDGMIEAVKAVVDNLESMRNQAKNAGRILQEKYSWKQAALLTMKAYDLAINR
jgi:glycosyltransferase involved in cell wall biosynthesis